MKLPTPYGDDTVNIAVDTLSKGKQLLVFVNTKRSAEAQADKIAAVANPKDVTALNKLADSALKVASQATRQCERLALQLRKGVAFHHAGLHPTQKELVEDAFREGLISCICATPTLAQGLDLPAFRVVIRDLKRFSDRGLRPIAVLEYEQMAGRAGRPGKEDKGEAITIAKSEGEVEAILEEYLNGEPEDIYSKLAAEPVLRTYVLSLIASNFLKTKADLYEFFKETFYAQQYGDDTQLLAGLDYVLGLLDDWEFLKPISEFGGADEKLEATLLGQRVSQLYLDPLTAHELIEQLKRAESHGVSTFATLLMLARTLEIRPLAGIRQKEYEEIEEALLPHHDDLYEDVPDQFDDEYMDFLRSLKLSVVLNAWISETGEHVLLEQYNMSPGELRNKLNIADWLIYGSAELAHLLGFQKLKAPLNRIRTRLKYGVREDVLPLLRLKGIGRVRARKMFQKGLRTFSELKKVDLTTLSQIIGPVMAKNVKEQLGLTVEVVKENKRKGQKNVKDYGKT